MDFEEFEKKLIFDKLGINETYGKIFSFIDFANVNNWFENTK